MARTHVVELPSGLVVTLRKFKVVDEDLLADPQSQRKGLAVTDLIKAITQSVEEPGLYNLAPTEGGGKPTLDWKNVLQGDRMTVLLRNRIFTWGDEMIFKQPCENCKQPVETEIDLSVMPVKPLPEKSRDHVMDPTRSPLSVKLPGCGVTVSFRLLRGKDDRALQRLQKQHKKTISSAYLRFRVVGIEGVPEPDWTAWLRNLDADEAAFLRAAFDEQDCGVDQEIEFDCDECSHIWSDDVKFRADFLFPKYRRRTTTTT